MSNENLLENLIKIVNRSQGHIGDLKYEVSEMIQL